MSEQGVLLAVPAHRGNPDPNQRYTIVRAVAWCCATAAALLGRAVRLALDVAACDEAHHAPVFYDGTEGRDGLELTWFGDVWCNPPWDDIGPWVEKAWREMHAGRATSVLMLLPGDRRHRGWWQRWVEPFRDGRAVSEGVALTTHDPPERFPYGGPGNPAGVGAPEPNFTSVLLVWRRA